jgi:hypothetical protein
VHVPEDQGAARVKVVGDHDVLGAWNSDYGLELARLPGVCSGGGGVRGWLLWA